jgi:hypothetical protein
LRSEPGTRQPARSAATARVAKRTLSNNPEHPEHSRTLPNTPEQSRTPPNILEHSRTLPNTPEQSRTFLNTPEQSRTLPNLPTPPWSKTSRALGAQATFQGGEDATDRCCVSRLRSLPDFAPTPPNTPPLYFHSPHYLILSPTTHISAVLSVPSPPSRRL